MKTVFSHGKESGPRGKKIEYLADIARANKFDVDSIDYTETCNPDERVKKLKRILTDITEDFVLVGSSMGGYVSLVAAESLSPQGIFLMAPALYMPGYCSQEYRIKQGNLTVVHGWRDEVIPVENSIRFGRERNCQLHIIDGDHRLNSALETVGVLFDLFLKKLSVKTET